MTPLARIAVREIPGPTRWDALVEALRDRRGFWLLESALHGAAPGAGRWSFAGCDPAFVLRARDARLALDSTRALAEGWPPAPLRWRGDPVA